MNNNSNSNISSNTSSSAAEKVIVLKLSPFKLISMIVRVILSLLIAVYSVQYLARYNMMLYVPYYSNWYIVNHILTGFIIFIACFFLINLKLYAAISNFNKKYIMRNINIELFVANVISLFIASIAYYVAYNISYWNSYPAIAWAIPVYIIVFYLFTRKKIKYIKEITSGIEEISKGNLDFKVAEKGNDEFRTLANNINKMSIELKNKIADERRADNTKNELITNVSHDLKTPLTTIIGYLTLVKDKNYDGEKTHDDYIERAYSKSLRLKKLIEDLFEYTKISNGVIKINKAKVNIVELMDQLLGEMSILARQNHLTFETNYSSSEIYVDVDSDLMARTFENILSNSIKYSYKELNSKISISILEHSNGITLSFENHGDTIPTEVLPLLFERFYRVDQSRNSKVSGSGLGLAISKSIVELHGGTISAESEANRVKIMVELNN